MEIKFHNTIDLERSAYHEIQRIIYTEQSVNRLIQYLVVLYWLSIFSGVMFFTIALLSPQIANNGLYLVVCMMLFLALTSNHFFLKITDFAHQSSTQKTFKQEGEVTIKITQEGLSEVTDNYNMFFHWKILKKLYATKTNFYIMFNGITLYIPMSAFDCNEILNRFALEMEDLSQTEIIKLHDEDIIDFEDDQEQK